jgi:hypothetical protein
MSKTNGIAKASEDAGTDPRLQTELKKLATAASRVIKSQNQPRKRSFCGIGPVKFKAAQRAFEKRLRATARLTAQGKTKGEMSETAIIELEGWITKMKPVYPKWCDEFDYIQTFLTKCKHSPMDSR